MSSIYDLKVEAADGSFLNLSDYKGKVILVVNTATGCGFTPHYAPIEEMYEKYHNDGFEVIDVPCNQFAGQAPESDEEIHEFCTLKYHTQFSQMKKSDVNGENAIDLFKYLKEKKALRDLERDQKLWLCQHCLRKLTRIIRIIQKSSGISLSFLSTERVRLLQDLSQQLI